MCADLARLAYRRGADVDRVEAAEAVGVLAHEATHLREADGGPGEAIVECHAMQRIAGTARALGVSPALARRLARAYWTEAYPTNAEEYSTRECRPGTGLDLRPSDPTWP